MKLLRVVREPEEAKVVAKADKAAEDREVEEGRAITSARACDLGNKLCGGPRSCKQAPSSLPVLLTNVVVQRNPDEIS